ncbi:MAG: riboflavin synthase [Acidobacteriota bacterium]
MFTGLIEALGTVQQIEPSPAGFRLRLRTPIAPELRPGESIAVNGVCLTVVHATDGAFDTDVSPETARVTTLTTLAAGAIVNLERPLRADARLGGHFVQGHVDATGTILQLRHDGESHWLTVGFPRTLDPYIVRKGSIAVDGISLTVADLADRSLDVQIIPFTWEHTNLQGARTGDPVNIECDILGKYVARIAELGWNEPREIAE